jgi:hypothetical protein
LNLSASRLQQDTVVVRLLRGSVVQIPEKKASVKLTERFTLKDKLNSYMTCWPDKSFYPNKVPLKFKWTHALFCWPEDRARVSAAVMVPCTILRLLSYALIWNTHEKLLTHGTSTGLCYFFIEHMVCSTNAESKSWPKMAAPMHSDRDKNEPRPDPNSLIHIDIGTLTRDLHNPEWLVGKLPSFHSIQRWNSTSEEAEREGHLWSSNWFHSTAAFILDKLGVTVLSNRLCSTKGPKTKELTNLRSAQLTKIVERRRFALTNRKTEFLLDWQLLPTVSSCKSRTRGSCEVKDTGTRRNMEKPVVPVHNYLFPVHSS